MAISGPPPKPTDQRRRRNPPAHGWVEVADVPFAGRSLPKRPGGARWPAGIAAKWRSSSRMPHCAAWSESDWGYALDSLLVAARFYESETVGAAAELRIREAQMGCTWASRQSLRLRYIVPQEDSDAPVTSLDDYRDL